VPGFTGVISDLGGPPPTCIARVQESGSRAPAAGRPAVFPAVCPNFEYRSTRRSYACISARARCRGIMKVLIASGVRYDLAIESPEYVKELAQPHTGGLLEDRAGGARGRAALQDDETRRRRVLQIQGALDVTRKRRARSSNLIPYFIAAHPGTSMRTCWSLPCG